MARERWEPDHELLVILDDEAAREVWVPIDGCVPLHGGWGSYERCEAVDDGQLCTYWAARAVTAVPLDDRGGELVDHDGYALPGLTPERRAVCWQHLPAAVFWAGERFGHGRIQVRLDHVHGGSWEQPYRFDQVQLGDSWGAAYARMGSHVEAVTR